MKHFNFCIFILILWPGITGCRWFENNSLTTPYGLLDSIVIKILESTRPYLTNLFLKNQSFETGFQEFGDFKGNISEVTVTGLEKFEIKLLNTSILDINNLTIVVENFTAEGLYDVNGTLAFPLGKNDIHFYGNGKFGVKFKKFSVSIKVIIRFESGVKIVKDLDIAIGLEKMDVYLENLMGGGDLEKVFNNLMNDVGLTVFDYYKKPILNAIKPEIIRRINEMLRMEGAADMKLSPLPD